MALRLPRLAGALIAAAALSAALPAAADTVMLSTRNFSGVVDPTTFTTSAEYVAGWNTVVGTPSTLTAGYGDYSIPEWNGGVSNQSQGGAGSNIAFLYSVNFLVDAPDVGLWSFRAAPDFGYGGTMVLDSAALDTRTTDLWWGGAYGATTQILAGSQNLAAGWHTLQVYGFEGCCDGGSGGQYLKAGAQDYQNFTNNGVSGAVPEPAVWTMMIAGFGLAGAALRRRRTAMTLA